jgi:hypothetical protein
MHILKTEAEPASETLSGFKAHTREMSKNMHQFTS